MKTITPEFLEKCREAYSTDQAAHTLNAAMSKTEYADLAFVPMNAARLNGDFSIEVKTHGITAQEKSGRCWAFACMNMMREEVIKNCNLEEFELSGNYIAFYDKLEKSNNFLQMVIDNATASTYDRMNDYILRGIGDGGYWDMAVDLVNKYGIVPKSVMPENYQSTHTDKFRTLMNSMLHKDAVELRALVNEGKDPYKRKEEMLQEIYKAEAIAFGEPVTKFDFCYRDKDNVYHADHGITPKEFYDKYVRMNLSDYVTITNEPTDKKELHKLYSFHYMGSMAESDVVTLNLPIEDLKELAIKQLKDNTPVWFACDSGKYGDRKAGVWDQASMDYEGLLGGVDLSMSKGDKLMYHESFGTHAMILTGVNLDENGKPDRYKIENSWGKENGKNGYFVCSDQYFDEFVYEVIIDKKHLSKEQLAMLEKEAVKLMPWEF